MNAPEIKKGDSAQYNANKRQTLGKND